jgi:hypothetical protein
VKKNHPMVTGLVASALIIVARGASASTPGDDTNNFRPDVFACEDAVSQLASCCPGFDPTAIRCVHLDYTDGGCDESTSYQESPTFDEAEASCIVHMSCAALVSNGVCERAQTAVPAQHWSSEEDDEDESSGGQDQSPSVCP